MVYLDVKIEEVINLIDILRGFELASGLKINYSKTSLIPLGECSDLPMFASVLGCKIGSMPFTYLGMPLGSPFRAISIWSPFVEKLENRLATWKRQTLSKGGRLVLLRSCLMNLSVYLLSLFPIPSKLALRMERLARNFHWGETMNKKAFCLVRWDNCKRPKEFGGLDIRGFSMVNMALLSKWIWRFTKEVNSVWKAMIKSKFGVEKGGVWSKLSRGSHGLGVWKQIGKQISFVHANSAFEIGNGRMVRFWVDRWCSNQPLRVLAPNLFRIVKRKHSLVSEVVSIVGDQITINMEFYLPVEYEFMKEIVLVHNLVNATPINLSRDDVLVWGEDNAEDDGGFSVKATFQKLQAQELAIADRYP